MTLQEITFVVHTIKIPFFRRLHFVLIFLSELWNTLDFFNSKIIYP